MLASWGLCWGYVRQFLWKKSADTTCHAHGRACIGLNVLGTRRVARASLMPARRRVLPNKSCALVARASLMAARHAPCAQSVAPASSTQSSARQKLRASGKSVAHGS